MPTQQRFENASHPREIKGAPTLRSASGDDVAAIADVWHQAWFDGHQGHVPEALYKFRKLSDFRERVPSRIPRTTVATVGKQVVGFVSVNEDELEQLFVSYEVRGSVCASMLLESAELTIGESFARAWLAVAAGNVRARRFYSRHHWLDNGPMEYSADITDGVLAVPVRKYEKALRPKIY